MHRLKNCTLVAVAFLVVACAAKLEGIPLVWMPTNQPGSFDVMEGVADARVQIEPMIDKRSNPSLLGANLEHQVPRDVTTSDNVAAFVTDKFRMLIAQSGFDVVRSGGTVIVKPELRSFYVNETTIYKGEVRIAVSVTDASGEVLWQGIAAGSIGRFGASYSAKNYYKTLSDSLIDAVDNLMKNPGFVKSLSGRTAHFEAAACNREAELVC